MPRKIFNYKSIVLVEETIKEFGYHPDKYGETSGKFIICICRYCGKPHKIRKGFFNKSGSACHKECRLEEQKRQNSPFSDPGVREKSKLTILKRYGVENASQNKEISKKISKSKLSETSKEKSRKTNLERYGVENVFQSEDIKKKIKKSNIKIYGVDHPMKNKDVQLRRKKTIQKKYKTDNVMKNSAIKEKAQETNLKRYGYKSPIQNSQIKLKAKKAFDSSIENDKNDNYKLINTLRQDAFWDRMSQEDMNLKDLCKEFSLNYRSVTHRVLQDEFKDKYYELYSFPRQQTQKEIKKIMEKMGYKVIYNTRKIIKPYELDIYLPEIKFAIEFNGSYWHSEAILTSKEARHKHIDKLLLCKEQGIRLFNIFEYSWKTRREQILNFIRTIVQKNSTKVFARKCTVNNDQCRSFIDKHHIQGYGRGTKKYFNLAYNNEIIASMTASFHHRQNTKGNPIVLNRFCVKNDLSIPGGASKIFKRFVEWSRNKGYDRIISFSDNAWTEGGIYKILGFDLMKEYNPDYFYWDIKSKKYLSKQSQKKSNSGCPKEITEREWSMNKGLFRIYDLGKKLWEYQL